MNDLSKSRILKYIRANPDCTYKEIALNLNLSVDYVRKAYSRLKERGFVCGKLTSSRKWQPRKKTSKAKPQITFNSKVQYGGQRYFGGYIQLL